MTGRKDFKSRGEFIIGDVPTSEPRPSPRRSTLWLIAVASLCVALGAVVHGAFIIRQRDTARAEAAELKQKLEAQATEQNICLKDNINLITWKVNAQMMLMEAADDLNFCAAHVPGRKFPRRRKLDLDDSFVGAEAFPPL